jgi:hypothetical protein
MGDVWDDAAAAKPTGTATATPPPPQQQSDSGDIWDQAAQRPIPPELNLGPPKEPPPPEVGIHSLADPSFLKSVPTGFAKSAGQTINTISKGLNAIPGIGESLAPSEGISAAEGMESFDKDVDTPEGLGEAAGAGLEGIGEFILGDEFLKGMTLGDKYNVIGKIHKALETSPKLQKAMELGVQSMRQSAVAGGQSMLHGASPSEALERAGIATVLGLPVGQITHWTPELLDALEMAQQNKYVKTPADMLVRSVNPPEEVSLGRDPDVAKQEYAKFDKELKSNLPYIIGHVQDSGEVPIGRRSFIDALVNTSNKFRDAYTKVLNPNKDVEIMASNVHGYKGALNKDTNTVTLGQLDSRLNDLNDILSPAYEKGKGGLPSEAAIGSEVELRKEAGAIRKVLYQQLQSRGGDAMGINVAETKARNGQIRDLADQAERRWQQARVKANTPLGDVAPTPYRAAEAGMVRGKRNLLGDPRDIETRSAWKMLEQRGDHGLQVGAVGPEPPPPTNAFVERTPAYVNIPERPTDIVWEGSTPEQIAAQRTKITNRANTVKNARKEAAVKIQQNKAAHGPRGEADATGEP